jgi:hypothetical protein
VHTYAAGTIFRTKATWVKSKHGLPTIHKTKETIKITHILSFLNCPYSQIVIIIISIQPLGLFWQESEPSQATSMALAH